jgi:hypothetical protein
MIGLKQFNEAIIIQKSTKSEAGFLDDCILKGQLLNPVALSYGILSLIPLIIGSGADGSHAVNLAFDHWDFGRKLKDNYMSFGALEQDAWRITDIIKAVLTRTGNETIKWEEDSAAFAALIIENNYYEEDFRKIIGINLFDDIVWYNKEGFDNALLYSSLFYAIDNITDIPMNEKVTRISDIYNILKQAEEKSEFQFNNLIERLTLKVKSTVKKTIIKKKKS